jgi:GntR family transcriptional regulator of arabinose operon
MIMEEKVGFMEDKKETLYSQIINDIKQQILSGVLKPGDKLPTELELAELYNVSRTTSQRALIELEREGFISRKQGKGSFVLSSELRGNRSGFNKIVSIILPDSGPSGRLIEYINGASDYLNKTGYYLTVHTTSNNLNEERDSLKNLLHSDISGAIFYPTERKNFDVLYLLHLNNYPIVTIDKRFQSLPLPYAISDNFDGGYKATSFLINNGHSRIAYISTLPIEDISSIRERFFGYCAALKENKIAIDTDLFCFNFSYSNDDENGNSKSMDILDNLLKNGVTAIFTEHDYLAIIIYRMLLRMNVRVPEDISLVGFDNIEMLEHLDIPLTTINQNFYEIGKTAAGIVVEMIENGYCEMPQRIIPVNMVIGKSVADIKRVRI